MELSTQFKEGTTFNAVTPFSQPKAMKVHIDYVLPSKTYYDETFVVYRVFGTHKRWWHTFICTTEDMKFYIARAAKK
jgi:hypothetical protein